MSRRRSRTALREWANSRDLVLSALDAHRDCDHEQSEAIGAAALARAEGVLLRRNRIALLTALVLPAARNAGGPDARR